MSKFVVYILDKAVWLLLATVITAQALQIAGVMETPKSAGSIEYEQELSNFHQKFPQEALRWKRDTSASMDRSPFIDMLFNRKKREQSGWMKKIQSTMSYFKLMAKIPIKTLTAMNNLIQGSRPAIKKMRDFVSKRFEKTTKAPEIETNSIQKRSPVYIRPVDEKN
ncbi:unnamed protein product [Ceutorhynchus assimilis]|uniref:Uncharacterized protein n=1 Tax=Ceutorhynchus assimilis TaxID=467358 RepID=A0A9N9QKH4_9CUCU|nr:unnamed protein product [Ceutorhynchus assimilis]